MLELNEELAEAIGVILGDGYFYFKRKKGGSGIVIAENSIEDKYYVKYLINLFKKFGVAPTTYKQKGKNVIYLSIKSKRFVEELLLLGLVPGPKKNLKIPELIKAGDSSIKSSFLRGIVDTDFCILFHKGATRRSHTYPIISTTFSNFSFIKEIKSLIEEFGIKVNIYSSIRRINNKTYPQYDICMFGAKNLELWIKNIGFRNEKHLSKIAFWEKFGYCPPRTTIDY